MSVCGGVCVVVIGCDGCDVVVVVGEFEVG